MAKKKQSPSFSLSTNGSSEWIFQFWAWQLLAWALYRYFYSFPEWIDELIFKPLVFVVPVLVFVLKKEQNTLSSIGFTKRDFLRHVAVGLGVGAIFVGEGIVLRMVTQGKITFSTQLQTVLPLFFLSFATAFTEEVLSRGFLFSRLYQTTKKAWYAILVSSLMFMAFHIPILATTLKFQGGMLILFFWTTLSLGIINSIFYFQTKSLVIPILVHALWNITVALFL